MKILSFILASLILESFSLTLGKHFSVLIPCLPESLKMRGSKTPIPKLYTDLRPYNQNTVHNFFSRVLTMVLKMVSFAILIALHRKSTKRFSS
jgi:hypothetical protein